MVSPAVLGSRSGIRGGQRSDGEKTVLVASLLWGTVYGKVKPSHWMDRLERIEIALLAIFIPAMSTALGLRMCFINVG